MAATDQVIALLTRIAEGVDTQNELLSGILNRKKETEVKPPEAHEDASKAYRTFTAEYIEVGFEKGKKTFRVFGAPFTKFGVRVWPEHLHKIGMAESLDLGQHAFTSDVKAELNDNNQPQKIVGLASS